jgi:MFS family permease
LICPRRSRADSGNGRLRAAARWLQLGWLLAAGAAYLAHHATGLVNTALHWLAVLGLLAGLTGIAALAVLLERLAEWTRDEDAQKMFNWTIFSWPLAVLLYVPVQFFMASWFGLGAFRVISGIMVILWVLAIITFPYGLIMLAKSVTLSILHSLEHEDREQRRQERTERFYQQKAAAARRAK